HRWRRAWQSSGSRRGDWVLVEWNSLPRRRCLSKETGSAHEQLKTGMPKRIVVALEFERFTKHERRKPTILAGREFIDAVVQAPNLEAWLVPARIDEPV